MFIITEAKGAEPMVTDGYLYIAEKIILAIFSKTSSCIKFITEEMVLNIVHLNTLLFWKENNGSSLIDMKFINGQSEARQDDTWVFKIWLSVVFCEL